MKRASHENSALSSTAYGIAPTPESAKPVMSE
ncbi:hypothetical protein ENSA7_50530 [Enhygromyxa salina]|uniref:Uncharacterized protein n=1 Tax=Enhygromyxa salina TaxID=215803 RepID=A0A2S9YII1_9BACT|nr:hypothetical protein ENSA7_50530 [Enhygromyxa salina]